MVSSEEKANKEEQRNVMFQITNVLNCLFRPGFLTEKVICFLQYAKSRDRRFQGAMPEVLSSGPWKERSCFVLAPSDFLFEGD